MKSTISLQALLTTVPGKEFGRLAEELFSSEESPMIAAKTAAFRHFGIHGIMLTLPPSLEGAAVSRFVVRAYDIATGTDAFEQCIDALLAKVYGVAVVGVPASTKQRRWQIDWYDNASYVETGRMLFSAVYELLERYHANKRLELPQVFDCRFQGWGLGAALSLSMAAVARKVDNCNVLSVVAGGIPNIRRRRYRGVISALRPVADNGFSLANFNVNLARLYTESKPDMHARWHRTVRRSTPRTARSLYRWLRFAGFERQLWRLLSDPSDQAASERLEAGFENVVVVTAACGRLGKASDLEPLFARWHQSPRLLNVRDANNTLGLLPVWALYALDLIEERPMLREAEELSEPEAASA